jgi:hypothetical protein
MNEVESAAMWDLYGRRHEAIAIQSTYTRLVNCLPAEVPAKPRTISYVMPEVFASPTTAPVAPVFVGEVQYVDYEERGSINDIIFQNSSMYKRSSFAHERELRAVIPTASAAEPPYETGLLVKISIQDLIEKVVVAPQAEVWFGKVVEDVSEKYGISKQYIDRSTLYDKPVY